jgi:hypothetical protein
MFFKGSRYEKVADATYVDENGTTIRYKRLRLIPPTPAFGGHGVSEGERLDTIAYDQYRDAERFWRICDANGALWPDDLLETGATIAIPPSEG